MLDARYQIADTSGILSPGLVIFRDLVESNLAEMIRVAGSPGRLRPHCKTHKMREIVQMQLARGIVNHKCATIAEAEMLAEAGAKDVFLAYNPVGPNIRRVVNLCGRYPHVRFAVTADHPKAIADLSEAMSRVDYSINVFLDIDCGQHRTGVLIGPHALDLYEMIANARGLNALGLHVYDGHNHQKNFDERRAAVERIWEDVADFANQLNRRKRAVSIVVAAGSASFPIFAEIAEFGKHEVDEWPQIELSPGTIIFHDWGYSEMYPDLRFTPAALLLTRVISRPTSDRVTLDLGYKAVASDPPAGNRLLFPDLPEAKAVLQNEEHLVLETSEAGRFQPGDELWAIPRHICPTCALHQQVYVVAGGKLAGTWQVAARNRVLTV